MNSLTVDAQSNVVSLSGELSFSTVKQVLEESTTLFSPIIDLDIDLSKVNRSDSAGLALLVHWMRVAKQENKKIVFHNIPSQMLAIADASGLNELLPIQ
ncbi:MAG: STAS domain-containing protein [Gammaproteobacteria bacterium]|nr:STAS domain-containing protein [Gammaproteobacteria bacterium]